MRLNIRLFCTLSLAAFVASGCGWIAEQNFLFSRGVEPLTSSGRVVISRPLPAAAPGMSEQFASEEFSSVIGYMPPTAAFVPAANQTWVEISSADKTIQIYRGQSLVRKLQAEGKVTLEPGTYSLQHKQKRPLWYAPDEYFAKRQIQVPPPGDRERYRRGALGQFALYPSVTFPIHSGPVWSEDVGGLRVSKSDLSAIYYIVPIGTSVVVK